MYDTIRVINRNLKEDIDIIMSDWINILISAIAGFLLPYLIKIIVYLFKRFDKTKICGY